ncbi:MAG: ROK family protein [Clostridia bacterium]|nr:ROK family protein [Clostridia bacterium]
MYKLGIDLGGTNIVAGVVDENYNVVATAKAKTNSPRPAEEIIDDMARVTFEAVKNAGLTLDDIDYMGVGTPGSINPQTGVVPYSNNLGFVDVPLCAMLKERVGKDFFIENDANAAAYGEFLAGSGKGTSHFVAITLGTGVGSGIIIDGRLFSGSNNAGGELGHTAIQIDGEACTCGRKGCWEAYASATALIRQTKAAMEENKDSVMWELVGGDISKVSGRTAFDAMRKGDKAGKQVVDQYIRYIGIGLINVINTFQPEALCIGGGISNEGDTLIKPLVDMVDKENYFHQADGKTAIKAATLGNNAGIIGAAYLCNLYK